MTPAMDEGAFDVAASESGNATTPRTDSEAAGKAHIFNSLGRMPWWRIAGIGLVTVGGAGLAIFVVAGRKAFGDDAGLRLDIMKVWLTLIAGYGAAVTLWLALRRQQHHEQDSERQRVLAERVANDAQSDAVVRRNTELYSAAANQLANSQPAVRLAGLYAFERLAQASPEFRQTVVDVMCAYLRMAPPLGLVEAFRHPIQTLEDEALAGEREVRLTAQRTILRHQRTAAPELYWSDVQIDLSGAHLHNFNAGWSTFSGQSTSFDRATFTGRSTSFTGVTFAARSTKFERATFTGERVWFEKAIFAGERTMFDAATFASEGGTSFAGATFKVGMASFSGASFEGESTSFAWLKFTGMLALFSQVNFAASDTTFAQTQFACRDTSFNSAVFGSERTSFSHVQFLSKNTSFAGAKFTGTTTGSNGDESVERLPPELARWGAEATS